MLQFHPGVRPWAAFLALIALLMGACSDPQQTAQTPEFFTSGPVFAYFYTDN